MNHTMVDARNGPLPFSISSSFFLSSSIFLPLSFPLSSSHTLIPSSSRILLLSCEGEKFDLTEREENSSHSLFGDTDCNKIWSWEVETAKASHACCPLSLSFTSSFSLLLSFFRLSNKRGACVMQSECITAKNNRPNCRCFKIFFAFFILPPSALVCRNTSQGALEVASSIGNWQRVEHYCHISC